MFSALFCLALFLIGAWNWRLHAIGAKRPPKGVPLGPAIPYLGNVYHVVKNYFRTHDSLFEVSAMPNHTDFRTWAFTLPLMPLHMVVCNVPDLEHVLRGNWTNYIKGNYWRSRLGSLLGEGIFVADGAPWHFQRKLAANAFNVRSFRDAFATIYADKMADLVAKLRAAAATGEPVDLQQCMYQFTLDTFAASGFGADLGCLRMPEPPAFAASFDRAQRIVNGRFFMPLWEVVQALNGDMLRLGADIAAVRKFASGVVARRRAALAPGAGAPAAAVKAGGGACAAGFGGGDAEGPRDLLGLFMNAEGDDGAPIGDDKLVDFILNFMIAGRDTTAVALTWTMWELLQHSEAQEALLAEVAATAATAGGSDGSAPAAPASPTSTLAPGAAAAGAAEGASSPDSERSRDGSPTPPAVPSAPTKTAAPPASMAAAADAAATFGYDELRRLAFTKACFLEGLRLHPSVPANVKQAVADDVLPSGAAVPAGSVIIFAPYTFGRLESTWGADAADYRPRRWLEMPHLPSAFAFPAFNAGPRVCLGRSQAELVGTFVLAGLLSRFRFAVVPGHKVAYGQSLTLPMKHGLMVTVEERA